MLNFYSQYYAPIQKNLDKTNINPIIRHKLQFNINIRDNNFIESFLNFINQRKTGYFLGNDEGRKRLLDLIEKVNFEDVNECLEFIKNLLDKLNYNDNKQKINLSDQLRNSYKTTDLYDFLFSFSYLIPEYSLNWDGRSLEKLSPGERGNLLLIFYLLLERKNNPLIIDQPEENLDNQTIYETLVPCIKEAKKRRQIIIVTHNPNLAVVCDAEQIIVAQMSKDNLNEIKYFTGSIENPNINNMILNILEGTMPAFDMRKVKYSII
jgi:predicted ATPase